MAAPDRERFTALRAAADRVCGQRGLVWHIGRPFCTDRFLAQFPHIPAILEKGRNALDMESAAAFRAAKGMGLPIAALLCVQLGGEKIPVRRRIVNALENRYIPIFKLGGKAFASPPGSKEASYLF